MGLDTTHDCWHGSYGSFAAWRNRLAIASGWSTTTEERRPGVESYVTPNREQYHDRNYQGWWDEPPADPLTVLFVHSDCDGWIFHEHIGPLADALDKIDLTGEEEWVDQRRGLFVAGLRRAESEGEIVEFR